MIPTVDFRLTSMRCSKSNNDIADNIHAIKGSE